MGRRTAYLNPARREKKPQLCRAAGLEEAMGKEGGRKKLHNKSRHVGLSTLGCCCALVSFSQMQCVWMEK